MTPQQSTASTGGLFVWDVIRHPIRLRLGPGVFDYPVLDHPLRRPIFVYRQTYELKTVVGY
jgi:hypothetical protein